MTPAPYTGADHEDLERLWVLAERRPAIAFDEAFDMLEHGTPRAVAWQAFQDFTPKVRTPLASRNPYAFEEWLEENGVDRWSDVPWGEQLADRYQRDEVRRKAEPAKIEGESDHLHLVHFDGCVQDDGREWIVTHCGIAVEATGQRDESVAGEDRAICQACVDALRASGGRCQVCSELLV